MTQLLKKMDEDLQLRNLQEGTRAQYLTNVKQFERFCGRPQAEDGTDEVRAYLLHLERSGLAPSTRNVKHAALKFFFAHTLGRPEVMAGVPRPKTGPGKLGVPLVKDQVALLLKGSAARPFDYTFFATLLATGLRVTEACLLQVGDVDRLAGLLHVRHGKGDKPRAVQLGDRHYRLLRRYWKVEGLDGRWLFPAQRLIAPGVVDPNHRWADRPVSDGTMRKRLHDTTRKAGLKRKVTPHDGHSDLP